MGRGEEWGRGSGGAGGAGEAGGAGGAGGEWGEKGREWRSGGAVTERREGRERGMEE